MKNRGTQRGSLARRGESWVVRYRRHVVGADGVLAYTPTTEKVGVAVGPERISKNDARVEAGRIVAEANAIAAVPQQVATFKQFVDARFDPEHIQALRLSGKTHYGYLLRVHILPAFGDTQLRDITSGRVQLLISSKAAAGLSKQTVTHIRNVISAVFRHAKMLGFWRGGIPTEGVRCHGKDADPPRSLSVEQVQLLVAAMNPRYRPLVSLLAGTGLRIGEALGLRWKFCNLTDKYVAVDGVLVPAYSLAVVQTYSRHTWGPPKTPRSRRTVPLSSTAWIALTEMRERDLTGGGDDPIFRGRTGEPFDSHNIAKRFLKKAGDSISCPWIHFHSLRHTAASLSEMDIAARQKFLGHSSAAMTAHYTHVDIEKVRAQLERVN